MSSDKKNDENKDKAAAQPSKGDVAAVASKDDAATGPGPLGSASPRGANDDGLAKERAALEKDRAALAKERADFESERDAAYADFEKAKIQLVKDREKFEREREALGQSKRKPGDVYRGPFRVLSKFRYTDANGATQQWHPQKDGYVLARGRIPDEAAQTAWRMGCLEPTAEAKELVPAPPSPFEG